MRTAGRARFCDLLAWDHQAKAYIDVWHALIARRGAGAAPVSTVPAQRRPIAEQPVDVEAS